MDIRYVEYCIADSRYYDALRTTIESAGGISYEPLVSAPEGWQFGEDERWSLCRPRHGADPLPEQGWKVHVAATPGNAPMVLRRTSNYCFEHGLAFKYLSTERILTVTNAKYAPREASGKFITIYPTADQLQRTVEDLDLLLAGTPGPYILSDLRWKDGPVHLRYGGFRKRYSFTKDGIQVLTILRPDGSAEPDNRQPYFVVPDWVELPDFLAPEAAQRLNPEEPPDFDFDLKEVLHFSNGGGVYSATRRSDGLELVLKEARPLAGLDAANRDAVQRLRAEHATLAALQGIDGVPKLYDYLTMGGHEFLAMEHVRGIDLQHWVASHYPSGRSSDETQLTDYLDSVRTIVDQIQRILSDLHQRGYVFNDLHPGNVLVDDDLRVFLLDFEIADRVGVDGARTMAAPGFAAPGNVQGAAADTFASRAVELYLHIPVPSIITLCPAKVADLVAEARTMFSLDDFALESIVRTISDPDAAGWTTLKRPSPRLMFTANGPWREQRESIAKSVLASASPDRRDRLFPGDIEQFRMGGVGLAYGASGVLTVLHRSGQRIPEAWVGWLKERVQQDDESTLGCYSGLSGAAYALHILGEREFAEQLFDRVLQNTGDALSIKLFDGLAGIGLVSLDFWRRNGDRRYLRAALAMADEVAQAVGSGRLGGSGSLAPGSGPGAERRTNAAENFSGGLLYGWSGAAAFMVRAHEVSGDPRLLDAARTALARDLELCESPPAQDALYLRDGGRLMPYLATGSAGVAIACEMVLRHVRDEELRTALDRLVTGSMGSTCVGSGLFNGRAGLLCALHRVRAGTARSDIDSWIARGARSLNVYAIEDENGLIFPGEMNLRLSTDYATGSVGVLHALEYLAGDVAEPLPFLGEDVWGPLSRTADRTSPASRT